MTIAPLKPDAVYVALHKHGINSCFEVKSYIAARP